MQEQVTLTHIYRLIYRHFISSSTASWQLPSADSRNGIIIGFMDSDVTGLDIYTEYEFEVLAFTSVGDGPKSSPLLVVRTMKDGKNFKTVFRFF